MNSSRTAAILLIGGLTLSANACLGNGMVLVPGSDGTFQYREQSNGFARHYGSGGQPIIREAERQASLPENSMSFLAQPEPSFRAPRSVAARPEVLSAIDQTAMRYGGHAALRKAGVILPVVKGMRR